MTSETLPPPVTGLPARDRLMGASLLALMLAADVAAWLFGAPITRWVAYIAMPGTLLLIWLCYAGTIRLVLRRAGPEDRAVQRMSAFMGRTLSMVGAVITIMHIGLVGLFAGWVPLSSGDAFLRISMVALAGALLITQNAMPKFIASCVGDKLPVMMRGTRLSGYVGVLCALGMIGLAIFAPINGSIMGPYLILAFLPTAIILGNAAITWLDRKRSTQP